MVVRNESSVASDIYVVWQAWAVDLELHRFTEHGVYINTCPIDNNVTGLCKQVRLYPDFDVPVTSTDPDVSEVQEILHQLI